MENIKEIQATSRQEKGKKFAKQLRRAGMIPAIIYGGDKEAIPVSLKLEDVKSILKTEKKENSILRFHRDDIYLDAMLKELQYDYLGDNIIHADFIRIDLEQTIDVYVPVVLTGTAVGVKLEDGIMDFVTREVHVRCLPIDIPAKIEVDVTQMHSGDSMKVVDLDIDKEKITFLSSDNTVLCSITSPANSLEDEESSEEEADEAVEEESSTEE